jgi:hypothetical protein
MKRRTVLTAIAVIAAGLGATTPLRHVDAADPVTVGRVAMTANEAAVVRYIAAWNERDAKRRRALVAQSWSEDGSYVGPSRQGIGHDAIDAIIAIAQERSPGWRMGLASGIDAHHDYVRFTWTAGGTPEAPLFAKGTVFARLAADGRLQSVIGFTDAAPAPPPK